MKRLGILVFVLVGMGLAGCSLPGRAFPGGPSPWLPGGAPNRVYAPGGTTQPAPAAATHRGAKRGSAE